MKKLLAFILVLIILFNFAYAIDLKGNENLFEEKKIDLIDYLESLDSVKDQFNLKLDSLPKSVKRFITNNQINLYLKLNNGEEVSVYGIIKNKRVQSLKIGSLEKADFEIYVSEEDINEILNSDDPKKEARKKLENKEINYKANGILNKIKIRLLINLI